MMSLALNSYKTVKQQPGKKLTVSTIAAKSHQAKTAFSEILKGTQQHLHTHKYSYSIHKEWNHGGTIESDNAYIEDLLNPDITPNGLTRPSGIGSSSSDIKWTEYVKSTSGSIERLDHLSGGDIYQTLIPNLNWRETGSDSQIGHAFSKQTSRYGIQSIWYRSTGANQVPNGYIQGKADQWMNEKLTKANLLAKS